MHIEAEINFSSEGQTFFGAYREQTGPLMYSIVLTRPDIAFTV